MTDRDLLEQIGKLRFRVQELEAAQQWQPIETAENGASLLFYGATHFQKNVIFTAWKASNGVIYDGRIAKPTHWMPLPETPE